MKDTIVLNANQEFFTISTTGESGASIRGTSRMSGIPQKTLSRWFESDLSHEGVPEPLKRLAGKDLYLSHEVKVRGKKVKLIRSGIVAKVVAYAAYALQKSEAIEIQDKLDAISVESYIQGLTGYLPTQYQSSTQEARYEITRLVREPNPWKLLYSAETCEKIRRWYFPKDFFWSFAYYWMTPEEIEFLNEHNPVQEGIWQRRDRIFQFLSQETRDRLAPEIMKLCTLVESSTGRQDFETRWHRVHGRDQQEFDLA